MKTTLRIFALLVLLSLILSVVSSSQEREPATIEHSVLGITWVVTENDDVNDSIKILQDTVLDNYYPAKFISELFTDSSTNITDDLDIIDVNVQQSDFERSNFLLNSEYTEPESTKITFRSNTTLEEFKEQMDPDFIVIITPTSTSTPLVVNIIIVTPTPSETLIPTSTPTPSSTNTEIPNTSTATFTKSPTSTGTNTFTPTATNTKILIPTPTPTFITVPTKTGTSTLTPLPTSTPTFTSSSTNTLVPTKTPTISSTPKNTYVPSATWTRVNTKTSTPTITPLPTDTPSPTNTFVPTFASTPTPTFTGTSTSTNTPTPTSTNTFTPEPTFTNTPTNTSTSTSTSTFTSTPTSTITMTPTPCLGMLESFDSSNSNNYTIGGDYGVQTFVGVNNGNFEVKALTHGVVELIFDISNVCMKNKLIVDIGESSGAFEGEEKITILLDNNIVFNGVGKVTAQSFEHNLFNNSIIKIVMNNGYGPNHFAETYYIQSVEVN